MKKTIAMLLALVMLFALAACSNSASKEPDKTPDSTPSQSADTQPSAEPSAEPSTEPAVELTGDPIKIGHIADMTGVESMTGAEAVTAMDFAKKMIEANGGINGHPIEIIVGDAQSNAATAADVARKLVEEDGVVAVLGPTQIGHKGTVAGYMSGAGVPAIYYNPTPIGMVKGNEYVISAGGGTAQFPTVMADYIYNELGYRTINTMAMDNTGGRNYIEPLIANFKALGGTVASEQYTPVPTPDFGAYMVSLPDADALVAWTSGSDAVNLWSAWYDMGVNERMPIVASMHGGFTDYYICNALAEANPAAAEAMVGTYAPMMYTYSFDSAENNEFVEAWVKEFGTVPGGTNLPGSCYQGLQLLKSAIESIDGNTEPEALYAALQAADITGPEGHMNFAQGRAATKDIHVVKLVKMEDGSFNYEIQKTYKDVPPTGLTVG